MPSPFPGMDPYLENPSRWPGVHHRLISEIQSALNKILQPKYVVAVEERVYISDDTDPGRTVIIPDARVIQIPERVTDVFTPPSPSAPSQDVATPIEVTTLLDEEIREAHLQVIDCARERVVTVIEVLSPSNKIVGSRGRASFIEKRMDVIRSRTTHWVEFDLLRTGERILARETFPPCHYMVYCSRANRRPRATLWPIQLRQRLPEIPLPLGPGDPDVPLNLMAILESAYDANGYKSLINYKLQPIPPLANEDAVWADALLREKGLRP